MPTLTPPRSLARLAAVTGLAILTSCSSPPLDLRGDPSHSGLLLLDAYVAREVVFGIDIDDPLMGASLASVSDVDDWFAGEPLDELVVFSGLAPGTYSPRKLATDSTVWNNWDPWTYYLQPREVPPEFNAEVQPGEVVYLGRLCVEQPSGFTGLRTKYRATYDDARERSSWKRLLRRLAPDSPWRPRVEARLRAMDAAR